MLNAVCSSFTYHLVPTMSQADLFNFHYFECHVQSGGYFAISLVWISFWPARGIESIRLTESAKRWANIISSHHWIIIHYCIIDLGFCQIAQSTAAKRRSVDIIEKSTPQQQASLNCLNFSVWNSFEMGLITCKNGYFENAERVQYAIDFTIF